jgi:hypothetical protein
MSITSKISIPIVLGMCLTLTGCSSDVQTVETHVINDSKPKLIIPEYPEVKMRNVVFNVIKEDDIVYYALDYPNYKNLSSDTLIIQNYIIHLKKVIKAYQDYYEPDTSETEEQNLQEQ